jgi:hypothetical protein
MIDAMRKLIRRANISRTRRPVRRRWMIGRGPLVGTSLGPHVMRDGERPARLCTLCMRTNRPPPVSDLRKRVTAIYWGSSGRRFKSCQPDLEKWALACGNATVGTSTPVQLARAWDHHL